MANTTHRVLSRMASAAAIAGGQGGAGGPRVVNANSRSLSLASVSSDGSAESHLVEQEDIIALTQDVRSFKEGLNRLRKVFQQQEKEAGGLEVLRVTSHERLSDVLKILRHMLEKYPALQSNDLVAAAGLLIKKVKEFDYEENQAVLGGSVRIVADQKDFFESLDGLALAFSSRVSEYLMGDLDSNVSLSSASSKAKSYENLLSGADRGEVGDMLGPNLLPLDRVMEEEMLSPDRIDSLLMHHDCGVDLALQRAKIWSKYAKDVISYVEKRTGMQLDFAKNLTKLVQTCRPQLQEESYLPFQSIYCTALDNDLELCASMQTSCGLLQGYKFLEPLQSRRAEHEKVRKSLKDCWHKELKRMHDEVDKLRKARTVYITRHQEWERCRDAARIAEQGAEIGATGENKLDKRKKLEEDAGSKAVEAENQYRQCVDEANSRHRNLLGVKSRVLQQIRELLMQADQTMKAVTVSYFQQQHTLTAPCPVQFQTLCESSRLYEPGSQYMKFVKRLPDTSVSGGRSSERDPFCFEPYTPGMENLLQLEKQRKWSASLEVEERRPTGSGVGPVMAWSPTVGGGEVTSETESNHSLESRESAKSRDTSPSQSPIVSIKAFPNYSSEDVEVGDDTGQAGISKRHLSKAASSHKFRKIQKVSKCRECDSYVYFQGYECADCGLASHKKCLETLLMLCGPKRLMRKMNTFGVDLGHHLLEVGEENDIPPLVRKCVSVVDGRGTTVKGIYRVSGVKSKVEKLCQAFENGAELVDLTDVHPNVIANVLKLYIRQLPVPLMTFKLYSDFVRVGRSCPAPGTGHTPPADEREAVQHLRDLCGQLPQHHFNTLAFLCHHLNRVAEQSDVNNMPASNLAIVFGPTLLKTTEGSASLSSLVDTVHQTRVVELLTKHAVLVFGPQEVGLVGEGRLGRRGRRQTSERQSETEKFGPVELRVGHGSFSDEEPEGENDPIPDFLRPDYSQKVKKSPMLNRASSPPPVIIKSTLKNFSGLEASQTRLPGQDSVDLGSGTRTSRSSHSSTSSNNTPGQAKLDPESPTGLLSPEVETGELRVRGHRDSEQGGRSHRESEQRDSRTSVSSSSIVSISEENKVKIQVPGLPSKTSTSSSSSRETADH